MLFSSMLLVFLLSTFAAAAPVEPEWKNGTPLSFRADGLIDFTYKRSEPPHPKVSEYC